MSKTLFKTIVFLFFCLLGHLSFSMDHENKFWIVEDIDHIIFENCIKEDLDKIPKINKMPAQQNHLWTGPIFSTSYVNSFYSYLPAIAFTQGPYDDDFGGPIEETDDHFYGNPDATIIATDPSSRVNNHESQIGEIAGDYAGYKILAQNIIKLKLVNSQFNYSINKLLNKIQERKHKSDSENLDFHLALAFLAYKNISVDWFYKYKYAFANNRKFNNTTKEALDLAMQSGHKDMLNTLIRKSENILPNYSKKIKLVIAIQSGDIDTVKLLLNKNAFKTLADYFYAFGQAQDIDILEHLISDCSSRLKLDLGQIFNGTTLLEAVESCDVKKLQLALYKGADINYIDVYGQTAVIKAVSQLLGSPLHKQMASILINNGADVNCVSRSGSSVLGLAIYAQDVELVKDVIELGAHVNFQDALGKTPIMIALGIFASTKNSQKTIEIIKILVAAGARLDLKDNNGRTALDIAKLSRCPEIIDLLKILDIAIEFRCSDDILGLLNNTK